MGVPGSNTLNAAFRLIRKTKVLYYKALTPTVDAVGRKVNVYEAPVEIYGSLQPVKRNLYQEYGLDFSKNYANFYASFDFLGVERDGSGDKIVYNGQSFQILSVQDWFSVDGWKVALLVKIPG